MAVLKNTLKARLTFTRANFFGSHLSKHRLPYAEVFRENIERLTGDPLHKLDFRQLRGVLDHYIHLQINIKFTYLKNS